MQEAEQQAQAQGCSHLLVDTLAPGAAVLSEIRLSAADVAARLPARRHAAPLFVEGAVTILVSPAVRSCGWHECLIRPATVLP